MIRILINLVILIILPIIMRINDTAAMIILFCCCLSFIALGIVFLNYKGTSIFSIIYNKPKDALEKYYDKKTLFLFEGWILIILSLGFFVTIAGIYYSNIWLMIIGVGYLIFIHVCSIIYSKNGRRFRK